MAAASDGTYWLEIPGASEEELRRGIAAARSVIEAAGADPLEAFNASWRPEAIEHDADQEMSEREWELFDLWRAADEAAVKASCEGWENVPLTARLMTAEAGREGQEFALETPRENPEAEIIPPPDPGPRYTF